MADATGARLCPETSPQPSLHPACADTRASCLRAICPYKMLWERSPCALLPNPACCKGKTQAWVKLRHCKTLTFAVDYVDHQMCYCCSSRRNTEEPPLLLQRNHLYPPCMCPVHLGRGCCLHAVHVPPLKW